MSTPVKGATVDPRDAVASGVQAPKYRNPENPYETWAGRGLKPRWLIAAIKGGKKLEDFAIGGAAKGSAAKRGRRKLKA
jgi:DNA-binding protein H-NS